MADIVFAPLFGAVALRYDRSAKQAGPPFDGTCLVSLEAPPALLLNIGAATQLVQSAN